jgi:predicted 3-demethylubiquinone-9 3-methyltransferase (glyoxalase superfamily)
MHNMQKVSPFLWFDNNAKEAMQFYTSIFPNSRIVETHAVTDGSGAGEDANMLTGSFELDGQEFMALNGGPQFKFTEAISLFVRCETQAEVDGYWEKLSAGGEESRCGWLKDKFGVSWQIVPNRLGELLGDPDRAKADRVLQAMLQMSRIDIQKLEDAAAAR